MVAPQFLFWVFGVFLLFRPLLGFAISESTVPPWYIVSSL